LHLTDARQKDLIAYASVDFANIGKQRYDEKIFYGNRRFKRQTKPALFTTCSLE